MSFETLEPQDAHAEITADEDAVFLDVRTVEEFDRGHPAGAINIPWALRDPDGGMAPNPDFAPTVAKHHGKDARLFLSCQGGVRSVHACRELAGAGFTNLINVDGGFGGRRNAVGLVACKGWVDSGLPVDDAPSTYESLKA